MYFKYHRLITEAALADRFSPDALERIVKANMRKDDIISNLRNPEHHFTENMIDAALAYIETQRERVVATLHNGNDPGPAWQAFGRLLHTAQDFYAHSNYVSLWLDRFSEDFNDTFSGNPPPDQIEALDQELLNCEALHTARTCRPLGTLGNLPLVGRWFFPLLPSDSHARMNLDSVSCGPQFEYAFAAAVKRTRYEFEATKDALNHSGGADLLSRFMGR